MTPPCTCISRVLTLTPAIRLPLTHLILIRSLTPTCPCICRILRLSPTSIRSLLLSPTSSRIHACSSIHRILRLSPTIIRRHTSHSRIAHLSLRLTPTCTSILTLSLHRPPSATLGGIISLISLISKLIHLIIISSRIIRVKPRTYFLTHNAL